MKKALFFLCAAVFCYGCSQNWYATRNVGRMGTYALQYPAQFAQLADKLNPCFIGAAKSDTQSHAGKPDTSFNITIVLSDSTGNIYQARADSFIIRHDTIFRTKTVTNTQTISLPYFTEIHDTVPDTRKIAALQSAVKSKSDSLLTERQNITAITGTKNSLLKWVIGLGLVLLAIVIIAIIRIF